MGKPRLAIICGPTATGKTRLAVEMALKFGGEVVSADSMQVYRGMDIGTAKPTAQEMRGVPHHMLSCAGVGEAYGAALYREQARACIADILSRGKLPILCGGTGLYISAVVYPIDFAGAGADEKLRAELQAFTQEYGTAALHDKLRQLDPGAASAIHPNNVRRVIRAIEKAQDSGTNPAQNQSLFNGEPLYDLAWVGLTMDRQALYHRIDKRVDAMMEQGLLDEVRRLSAAYSHDSTAFQALGYKELLDYIVGKTSLADAVGRIKAGTRSYAKRQMTWFRRESLIRWFNMDEFATIDALDASVFGYIQASLHMTGA